MCHSRVITIAAVWSVCVAAVVALVPGCQSGFQRIDGQVQKLLDESNRNLGPETLIPDGSAPEPGPVAASEETRITDKRPSTVNPSTEQLKFKAISEADDVLVRLRAQTQPSGQVRKLDLGAALTIAAERSREYQFAEEEYVLAALSLLVQEHLWGPLFFDEVGVTGRADGVDGFYDSSLNLVNEFRVTQRLPYGGEVSARALARATEQLHDSVAGPDVQSAAAIILAANIPLLRGAGLVAQEDRIQANRNLVYAARNFEQFRRDFLFDIAQDFLNLVFSQQAVSNAERQVTRLKEVEKRERTLYEAGRTPLFQAALAEQSTYSALDTLNNRRESYRLAVDRFKVRIGFAPDEFIEIVRSSLELPIPDANMDSSVRNAMLYRLDVQTQRDRVDDSLRGLSNARNGLLPDLNLNGVATLNTNPRDNIGGAEFLSDDNTFVGGVTFGLPLDREVERINLRQSQIQLQRSRRDFDQLRDDVAVEVRAAVRDIDRSRYALQIQEKSVAIGEQRKESIEAAPDRATARDASDAANALLQAQDRRDSARRDLQVAILRYLLLTGQLRVDAEGHIIPLPGMMDPNAAEPPEPAAVPIQTAPITP